MFQDRSQAFKHETLTTSNTTSKTLQTILDYTTILASERLLDKSKKKLTYLTAVWW